MATANPKKKAPAKKAGAKKKAAPKKKATAKKAVAKKPAAKKAAPKKAAVIPLSNSTATKKPAAKKPAVKKAAAKKPAAKKSAAKKVVCAVSPKATNAARILRDSGTPAAGRYLASVAKPAANACAKENGTYRIKKRKRSTSPAAKKNYARIRKISKEAKSIYDKPGYKGTIIDATVQASKQLKRAGTL